MDSFEGKVQLVAKDGKWMVVRSVKLGDNPDYMNAILLSGMIMSLEDRLMKHYIPLLFHVEEVDKLIKEDVKETVTAVSRRFKKLCKVDIDSIKDKNEKEALKRLLKVYAARKWMEKKGVEGSFGWVYRAISPR